MDPAAASLFGALTGFAKMVVAIGLCSGLGYGAARLGSRHFKLGVVSLTVLLVMGLRLATFSGHLLSRVGMSLRVLVWCLALGGAAGLFLFCFDLGRRRTRIRLPRWYFWVPAVLFFGVIGLSALFAPPSGWDVFTHWLTLPHEMVLADSLLSMNTYTNSVAPTYALHHSVLVSALLLVGVEDGRLNPLSTLFVTGTCVVIAAAMTLSRIDLRTRVAGFTLAAGLLTALSVIFGFLYGDALLILGLAIGMLGLVSLKSTSQPRTIWWLACLVTAPLIGKGYGHLAVAVTCLTLVGVSLPSQLRERLRVASPQRTAFLVGALGLLILLVERHLLYLLTVQVGESNDAVSAGPVMEQLVLSAKTQLASLLALMFDTPDDALYFAMTTLIAVVLVVFAVNLRRRKQGLPFGLFVVPAAAVFAAVVTGLLAKPHIVQSLPRYSLAFAPSVILGLALLSRPLKRRKAALIALQVLIFGLAVVPFVAGELPGYLALYFPTSEVRVAHLNGTDPEAAVYRPGLLAIASAQPRITEQSANYILVNEEVDAFLGYRVMLHLAVCGFRGHLYSDFETSRTPEKGPRAAALRKAILERDISALRTAVVGFDLVVLNVSAKAFPPSANRVFLTADLLAEAEKYFSTESARGP